MMQRELTGSAELNVITLKQILVPTDFSAPSEIALKYAKAFAKNFSARIHLLHVIDDSMINWQTPEGTDMIAPLALEELERRGREQLASVRSSVEAEQVAITAVSICGSPALEIVAYAKKEAIDMIVLGTHGRAALAHLLMGSVAEKVVRKAPCPVLSVREAEHEFVD